MNRGAMRFKRTRFVFIAILILVSVIVGVASTGGTAVAGAGKLEMNLQKLDPALQAIIVEREIDQIPVIVQKEMDDDRAEQLVNTLGGTVSQEFSIINAFATELDAASIKTLAQSPAVAHISLYSVIESS